MRFEELAAEQGHEDHGQEQVDRRERGYARRRADGPCVAIELTAGPRETISWYGAGQRDRRCTGAAAVAVHMIIYCDVHFPMSEINTVFTVALIWGVAMSIVSEGATVFNFRPRGPATGAYMVSGDFTSEPGSR